MSFGLSRRTPQDLQGWGLDREDLPQWENATLDPRLLFADPNRRFELEIGSGKGTFLVQQAAMQTDTNFLGIEWAGEFQRYAADRARRHTLNNVRVLRDDGSEFLTHRCADHTVDVIHLYFTDPWPKKRHHKRRLVQHSTLQHMHRVLKLSGQVHLVTDHAELWEWYELHVEAAANLFDRGPFVTPQSAGDEEVVGTNFERKYRREGRSFNAMTLTRVDNLEKSDAS
ncbi:MAG: tRNA (guanosine(46)-N7)-methyltransferase TrmB [Phycisphaerales bacterium]|nr:tRNA (guanosine(46)-N7)-methyltransferase TrmB [Phycisphaerales bacterium]